MVEEVFTLVNLLSLSSIFILMYLGWLLFRTIEIHLLRLPPGPIGLLVFGEIFSLSKPLYKSLADLGKRYGSITSYGLPFVPRIIAITDYDSAKELLSHPAALSRPTKLFGFVPGKAGFATMNGKQWVLERKYAMQALRNLGFGSEPWAKVIRVDVDALIALICERHGDPMDIREPLHKSGLSNTLLLIGTQEFLDSLTNDDFKSFRESTRFVKERFLHLFITAALPWLKKYFEKFNLFGFAERKKATETVSQILRNVIEKLIKHEVDEDNRNFVNQYITEVRKDNPDKTIDDATVECLLGDIVTFIVTNDTAMLGTQWMFYFMAAFPEIQRKVHAEIYDVIGRNVAISWEDRWKLPYTMACIIEMERWVTLVAVDVPRSLSETIEFHGYLLPKDSIVIAISWAINRDPKYWDRPDEYIPDRFLKKDIEKYSSLGGYAPFGLGKRSCPGEKAAIMSTFLYFTSMLQRFEVRTPSGEPPDLTGNYNTILEPINQDICFIERK